MRDPQPTARRDPWLGVEFRHLAALAAVAREGSFRRAADDLGYVQSAVSQQVAQLERVVGARLVDRSRGNAPVSVTEAGRLLLEHVDAVLARLRAAQADLAALAEGRTGTLRVGAFQSAATRILPRLLPAFAAASPDVRLAPTETHTDAPLFELVERGAVDVAFCELPLVDGPFESVALMQDPFVLMVAAGSPLVERDEPPALTEVGALPLVGYHRSRAQARMVEALEANGIEPKFVFRSDLNATVQALVAAEIGIAIVPYLTVDPEHPGTAVLEQAELPTRTIGLVWNRERRLSAAAELFVDLARASCEGVLEEIHSATPS